MKKLFLSIFLSFATIFSPVMTMATTIVIQPGDTLSALAKTYNTSVQSLVETNQIQNPDLIRVGQTLEVDELLGAAIPTVIAGYQDSIASRLNPSGTSFTLVRGTDKQSRSLNGFYGFVLDEGSTTEEFMTANCVATACTIVTRGIDVVDGETSVTALKTDHRRGASAKITNYPQLAILSRILNGLESASSTFSFGDGNTTSTANKCLRADNGTASLPKICYNETLAKWQFSDDGVSTITFATSSASGLSASTTRSIVFTDSKVVLNASSSRGLLQDTTAGTYNGYLYLNASTTQGLKFGATLGDLQFDQAAALNLTGNVTSSGTFRVGTPVSVNDAIPKVYADNGFYFLPATTTADQTVTAGRAIFATSTGYGAQTNTSAVSSTFLYIGLAATGGTNGQTITYTRAGGINCSQSGLTPGADYFLNGTAGQISLTPATNHVRIGRALTATCIQLDTPYMRYSGSTTFSGTGSTYIQTAFYPSKITLAVKNPATNNVGASFSVSGGGFNQYTVGLGGGGLASSGDATDGEEWNCKDTASGTVYAAGTVSAKSSSGMTLTESTHPSGTTTVYYSVENF